MQMEKTKQVAAIANQFIQNARYKLTPREQKLILFMATLLRPEHSDFEVYLVPVSEIEHILKTDETKKHGSFYERLDKLLDSITDKKISFPTDFTLDGARLRGHINWVAGAVPKYNEDGVLCVEFGFSPQMKPFLLGLKEKFTQFEFLEVAKMKSGFSIRMYQMCKSYYYEHIRHGRNVLAVSIRELKHRLGISDKYPDFRNFRRKVLNVAKTEINENTRLRIDYDFIKKGRNITDLRIVINEKDDLSDNESELKYLKTNPPKSAPRKSTASTKIEKRIEKLTEGQRRAFNTMTEYGVSMSFALDGVLPMIKGSELVGYEDFFVLFMLAFFEKKTNVKTDKDKVKAFTGWVNNKRFEEPNLYAQLMEQVVARKKRLKDMERINRERAKNIPASEFRKLLEEERAIGRSPEPAFTVQNKTAQASRMNRVGEVADLFSQKEESVKMATPVFDFAIFKKEHAAVFKRIHRERKVAFEPLKTASNYKQLLENSVQAYCEQWLYSQR